MVRAGESAKGIENFAERLVVAIGWHELGKVEVITASWIRKRGA